MRSRVQQFKHGGVVRFLKWSSWISCLIFCHVNMVCAQRQLQDNFCFVRFWTNTFTIARVYPGNGMAIDSSNRCYIANGNALVVYDAIGNLITNIAITSAQGVCIDLTNNVLYVCSATSANQIRAYDAGLHLVRQWGTNSLNNPNTIAVAPDGNLYIADTGNNQVQVFTPDGKFIRKWGQYGTAGGQFNVNYGIAINADSSVFVTDFTNTRIQKFDTNGNYIAMYNGGYQFNVRTVAVSVDGVVFGAGYYSGQIGQLPRIFSSQLDFFYSLSDGASDYIQGATFSPDGQFLYLLTQTQTRVFRRTYRTMGTKLPNAVPLPVLLNCAQRSGTTVVDLDFMVIDPDNTNLTCATIAFLDGRTDLAAAIKMNTFSNRTTFFSPSTLLSGQAYHLAWCTGTDYPTNLFNVKINILAKDNRGLMDFHFLTLPAMTVSNLVYTNTLVISRIPIQQNDFLGVWTWLVANNDTNVVLQGGNIYSTGNNSNVLYAQTQISGGQTNTITTLSGRNFLFSLMNVREATSGEIYRARIGTTGRITQWPVRVSVGNWPQLVNEFGFDTSLFNTNNPAQGVTNAWWVVPLP